MKYFLCILMAIVLAPSCKKVVEDKKKDLVLDIMTNGVWHVKSYMENEIDISPEFEGYSFQFKEDETVTANKGTTTVSGSWRGEIASYSIISEFPGAGDPLKKLNGTWKLKDSGETFVVAEMTTLQGLMRLRLEKNP